MIKEEKKLILDVQYGGLGDNLFLSPIPRLFKQKYPKGKVYLSNNSKFRSTQIKEVIWDLNPYIDGFCSQKGEIPKYEIGLNGFNILTQLANSVNIETKNNLEPEIYYQPCLIESFSDTTLVDLNYTSFVGSFSKNKILRLLKLESNIVLVNPPKWAINIGESITSKSLKHYIDLIYSSKKFICFTSGGATLAAAIKKPSTCLFGYGQNLIFHHSSIHNYINIERSSRLINFIDSYYLRIKNKIRIYLTE